MKRQFNGWCIMESTDSTWFHNNKLHIEKDDEKNLFEDDLEAQNHAVYSHLDKLPDELELYDGDGYVCTVKEYKRITALNPLLRG